LRRWAPAALLFLSVLLTQASGKYPTTPTGVVRLYCEFDFKIGRISTENFAKLPPLTTWEEEPGWDTVTVVSGFKILSSKQFQDHAVVSIKWNVLGQAGGESVTSDQKSEVIDYQLRLVKGLWKIESPVTQPHVSFPTLRAFIVGNFQKDPKRQAIMLRNLDALRLNEPKQTRKE